MATPTPDDEVVREAYRQWRQRFNKGEFDPARYQNFKSNYLAVTQKNNMELQKARQMGQTPSAPIQLNEYGDCSADEYRAILQRTNVNPTTKLSPQPQGLQPTNDFNNPKESQQQSQNQRQQQMNSATSNLRAAMDQRTELEAELQQLKVRLEERQRLLQQTLQEEQYCKNRIALREEQKRLLNERLRNGWEDEKGMMN